MAIEMGAVAGMRRFGWIVLIVFFSLLAAAPAAHAEKRLALLIANQGYAAEIGPLKNPHNDIRRVGAALAQIGFNIGSPLRDATREQILLAVHDFADRLKAAGPGAIGFLYYSGHGVAVGGENLLVPVNVRGASSRELEISGVRLAEIVAMLNEHAPHAAHFVVFDACRNNLGGARGSRGFVPQPERPGMLVAFSTSPGNTASDEGSGSGPYAAALAAEMVVPGRNHDDMFFEVRKRVAELTRQEQVPWTQDGLLRQVHFGGQTAAPTPGKLAPQSEAEQVWVLTKESGDKSVLEAFIARYGDTFYAELARARLREIEQGKIAALAKPALPAGRFDGTWLVNRSGENCRNPKSVFLLVINNDRVGGKVTGGDITGTITVSGAINFAHKNSRPGGPDLRYAGKLEGKAGAGTFAAVAGACRGAFAVTLE